MSDIFLDPALGKNNSAQRLGKGGPSKPVAGRSSANKISFKDVLKETVEKTEGAPEIRRDLVEKFKSSLADGTYEVKTDELAEKMIQKIRENKTRVII